MRWPRQTTAAKARGLHSEVATVFLHQHVRSHFARTEERMFRLVNGHRFINADLERMFRINLPPLFQFYERQPIWRVAIDLVRAGENENGIGTMLPRLFEHVQRTVGIDAEIRKRIAGRPVM